MRIFTSKWLICALWLSISSAVFGQPVVESPIPSSKKIRQILDDRVGRDANKVGIIVGVIEPTGRRIVTCGSFGHQDRSVSEGSIIFEIGAITKAFTSLLLADMVERGDVGLMDPIAKYLRPGVKIPEHGGSVITLKDLALHQSALPPLPTNFMEGMDPANPYAHYSEKQLYKFLSGYTLPRDVGLTVEYSNFGYGLLGHTLALAAGQDYEALVRTRITQPLGMSNTAITLSPSMKSRLALGHNSRLEPVSNWKFVTFAGAAGLLSTVDDMLTFLAVQLRYRTSALDPAIAATQSYRRPIGSGVEVSLGWSMLPKKGSQIAYHYSRTGGYSSFLCFDPKEKTGVVVMANMSTAPVEYIALQLLDTSIR